MANLPITSNPSLYNMMSQLINTNQGNAKGDFYGLLGDVLSKQLTEGMPNLGDYKQFSEGSINKSFDTSRTRMKEDLASRGMGGSGAALAAMAQLGGERASALSENAIGLSQMDADYRTNALSQLMGLNQFGAGMEQQQWQNYFNLFAQKQATANFDKELKFQKDSQPSDFASLLGTILGASSQVATASLLAG